MKNFKLYAALLVGMLLMGHAHSKTIPCTPIEKSTCEITDKIVTDAPGKDYDFSSLKPGETADVPGYDRSGKKFMYRVTKTSNGIDVAVYTNSLKNIDPDTQIAFKGPNGEISSTTVGQVSAQRCGWICVLAHVFCVKIHLGPPGNTWEWDCDTTSQN